MINKVIKIIKISKLEAHVKTPPETSVSTPWGILFGNMWLQYHKSLPTSHGRLYI
jgi:hypothetical protein